MEWKENSMVRGGIRVKGELVLECVVVYGMEEK
jgi:hypothetical protein